MPLAQVYDQWSSCRATINGNRGYILNLGGNSASYQDSDITAGSISKDIKDPCGSFVLTLQPRQDYLTKILVNDWIEIFMDAGGGEQRVMYGLVDSCRRVRVVSGKGEEKWVIQLCGRDWGKALLGTKLIFDPNLGGGAPIELAYAQLLQTWGAQFGPYAQSPGVALQLALQYYLGISHQFWAPGISPDGQPLYNLLDLSTIDQGFAAVQSTDLQGSLSGNLWDLMKSISIPLLHELFTDWSSDPKVALALQMIFRMKPFSAADYNLATVGYNQGGVGHGQGFISMGSPAATNPYPPLALDASETNQDNIGVSEYDIRNWIRPHLVFAGQTDDLTTALRKGVAVPASIYKNGLQVFEPYLQLWPLGFNPQATPAAATVQLWPQLIDKIAQIMAEWWGQNETLLTGSFIGRLRPEIHVGRRVNYNNALTGDAIAFYLEAYNHSFVYAANSSSMTAMTVTRGVSTQPTLNLPTYAQQAASGVYVPIDSFSPLTNPFLTAVATPSSNTVTV